MLQQHVRTCQQPSPPRFAPARQLPRDFCCCAALHYRRRMRTCTEYAYFKLNLRVRLTIIRCYVLAGGRSRPCLEHGKAATSVPNRLTRCLPSVGARHNTPPMLIATLLSSRACARLATEANASSHMVDLLTYCELARLRFARSSDFQIRCSGHHSAFRLVNRSSRKLRASARLCVQVRT